MTTPESPGSGEVVKAEEKSVVVAKDAPHAAAVTGTLKVEGKRRPWLWVVAVVVVIGVVVLAVPWIMKTLRTVSTDDAYVNGHATFVAPRVEGQVVRVLVDDNNRVRKGDLLVQLDKEPYQTQVNIAQAAMAAAQADVVATAAQIRGQEGETRGLRFALEHSIEDVDNQVAVLRSKVATLGSEKATLVKAQADYDRGVSVVRTGAITQEELDLRKEALSVAQAQVEEALQGVYQVRVSLGLPPRPEMGDDLTEVPADLDQTFSSVKEAQAKVLEAASALGVVQPFSESPKEMVTDFYKRDPQGNIDRIYAQLVKDAPQMKQAESKVLQAQRNLDQALLNLRYCDVFAEIDGVVTRRDVNPGNNVIAGQSLMVIRSVTDIWVDANFKETQLADLRIGQTVDLDVDMYGKRQRFKGRVSGFTIGTGSTLALLPAENATGNFVKVVQRLPVRIDLVDYDPEKAPLFLGLSVTPYVDVKAAPTGENAGRILQPYITTTGVATEPATMPATGLGVQP
jgi:membrane fusion protein (multidrug efflux system)